MKHPRWPRHVPTVVLIILALIAPAALAGALPPDAEFGTVAYGYVKQLSAMPRFFANVDDSQAAADAVEEWLEDLGYKPTLQPFVFNVPASQTRWWLTEDIRAQKYASKNVVALKPAAGQKWGADVPLVIVGAHYDAVPAGQGADDNASGMGVLLETAARLVEEDLPYDLAFVAFGAEEAGLVGSDYFVKQMTRREINRTIVMINFDSLIAGDFRYIHAGSNGATWARDSMLGIIDELGLDIIVQPGLNKKYPSGFSPNGFSDYTAFNKARIPIVAFESTNWSAGDLDGYQQTVDPPYEFWHTANDTLATIETYHPARPREHLQAYSRLVYEFLANLEP